MIEFAQFHFHPVILLPPGYEVYDFTRGYDADRVRSSPYGIGRYDEERKGMYDSDLFQGEKGPRTIHMGIDIGAPVGTPVHAFFEGKIFLFGRRSGKGDYGHVIVTRHELQGEALYALYGHLSAQSLLGRKRGQHVEAGEIIAWVGNRSENGGWNPHLHFQLSLAEPEACDMPGAVSAADREEARKIYPDPRLVLGPLY